MDFKALFLTILAGFALIYLPTLTESLTYVSALTPILTTVGYFTVGVFSLVVVYRAVRSLLNK
ncbi:hypothetical protein [Peribacillus alkalitolerans]|uniref:hypothetical protein n=1 Tax=Peribacillus alkalitolerans TaxID=1550385 RepID=UPI0013D64760|nr:hypothetical protein [Peribacillus alkalitolerans]